MLIIAVLATGLAQSGVQEPTKRLITGFVIVSEQLSSTTTATASADPIRKGKTAFLTG